jgi:hypothetical protein
MSDMEDKGRRGDRADAFPAGRECWRDLFGLVLIRAQMPKALNSVEYSVTNAAKCG